MTEKQDGPAELLASYDAFMAGSEISAKTAEAARQVSLASAFAVAAYNARIGEYKGAHALARAFLLALVDDCHPELDYLRHDPNSGNIAREAKASLDRIAARTGGDT